jgi:hypothetical protein
MRRWNWSGRVNRHFWGLLVLALVIPFLSGEPPSPTVQNKKKAAPKASPKKAAGDQIPDGPELSLDFVIKMLGQVKADVTDEARIVAFVDKRGLDFLATPQNLKRLEEAGASPNLLQLVTTLKPPPAPPPPPPPVTATLPLSCAPAECSIRLDGGRDQQTTNGRLIIAGLALKSYSVDFRKDGYAPKTETVTVSGPKPPELKVTLEPTPESKAAWGRDLFKATLQAIGGKSGLAELKSMTANGAASSWDLSGTLSEWAVKAIFTPSGNTYDIGNASSGSFTVGCRDGICGPKGKSAFGKKKVTGGEAASINTNIVQYDRYQLVSLFDRINGENHKLTASAAPAAGAAEQHLIVDSLDETYDMVIDGAFLPASLTYKSKDGLASATVTYAQWAAFETGSKYPRHTSIAIPGVAKHGIQVRFETLTSGSK